MPGNEFYDYADKYLQDDCQLLAPAPLDEDQQAAARKLAVAVFRTLGCEGMARVDFLVNKTGRTWNIYLNELNSIPGFTSISMYPKLWEASGLKYGKLLDILIKLALERHQEKSSLQTTVKLKKDWHRK